MTEDCNDEILSVREVMAVCRFLTVFATFRLSITALQCMASTEGLQQHVLQP